MSYAGTFFCFELRRFLSKRVIASFLVLFLLLFIQVNIGIKEYNQSLDRAEEFYRIEAMNFAKFTDYDVYGDEGHTVLFNPAPVSIFFSNVGIPNDLIGNFDSIVHLGIYDNYKDDSLFFTSLNTLWSFSGLLLLFGSLLALLYGYEAFKDREYLKFLSGIISYRKVYLYLALSRIILLFLALLAIFVPMIGWASMKGVVLSGGDLYGLAAYFLVTLLTLIISFLAGTAISTIFSRTRGLMVLMVVWIVFVFLIPGFIQNMIARSAVDSTQDYRAEIEKFKIVVDFQKEANKSYGGYYDGRNKELANKIMENYWNTDYKKSEALEEGLKGEISANIKRHRDVSLFIPTLFYQLSAQEVSSRGYGDFLAFYTYLQELKAKFVRFYIDRYYYHDPREIVNFIQGKENLYFSESRIPEGFWIGLGINLVYLLMLFMGSFYLFKKKLYALRPAKECEGSKISDIKLKKGEYRVWVTQDEDFKDRLYTVLSGNDREYRREGYKRRIIIGDREITSIGVGEGFFYLCHPDHIPADVEVGDFVEFIGELLGASPGDIEALFELEEMKEVRGVQFGKLDGYKRGAILLSLLSLSRRQIYLFNDVCQGMPIEITVLLKKKLDHLKDKEGLAISLTNDAIIIPPGSHKGMVYFESDRWTLMVEDYIRLL